MKAEVAQLQKLNWGLIGGGEGSQIGPTHRLGAGVDGLFELVACALDADPQNGTRLAAQLVVAENRAYGNWREMLAGEKARPDRLDLVTVATPNATHFEITKAFLEAGIDVFCEKPMTMTVCATGLQTEVARPPALDPAAHMVSVLVKMWNVP